MAPTVAILALQGAFAEHGKILDTLGVNWVELRQASDLHQPIDALILPGGESTVQGKLLVEQGMLAPLRQRIADGLPTLATCAGLILLAESIQEDTATWFGTLPITVRRNAYGRQLGSFATRADFGDLGPVPMTFIRAPYIVQAAPEVRILAEVDGKAVACVWEKQLAMAFHPELDDDLRIHQQLIRMIG